MIEEVRSYDLLKCRIDPLTITHLNEIISEAIRLGRCDVIANHNLHSIYLYHHDAKMRAFYEQARYVHIDGMSLVLLGRLLGLPLKGEHRVTYVDWLRPLMTMASRREWRIFYLGSKPGVAQHGTEILRAELPDLQIETAHGYFDCSRENKENQMVLSKINSTRPHILMVGMGMPRQEHWISDNLTDIEANVILTAGACIDYVAGAAATSPRWMGRMGLEWVYRLGTEPRRLWRRYLWEPWFLVGLALEELFRNRRSL